MNPDQILTELPILAIINSNFARDYFLKTGKINKSKLKQDLSADDKFLKAFTSLKPAEFIPDKGVELSKSVINKIEEQSALSLLIVFPFYAKNLGLSKTYFQDKIVWLGNKSMQEKCLQNEHMNVIQMLHMQSMLILGDTVEV